MAAAVLAAAPRLGCQWKAEELLAAVPSPCTPAATQFASRACLPFIGLQVCAPCGPYGTAGPAGRCCAVPAAQVRGWGPATWECCRSNALHHAHARPIRAGYACSLRHVPACGVSAPQLPHCAASESIPPHAASAGTCSTWAPTACRCGSSPWCRCSTTFWGRTARCVKQPENTVLQDRFPTVGSPRSPQRAASAVTSVCRAGRAAR